LRSFDGGPARQYPDLPVTEHEHQLISRLHAERAPVASGDSQPAILTDSFPDYCHVTGQNVPDFFELSV